MPLWSCFAFISRNIDQNTATNLSLSTLLKQPKTSTVENRPIIHCKLSIEYMYIIYASRLSLLIPYLIKMATFWYWSDECC